MEYFPVFLSLVLVVRNQSSELRSMLAAVAEAISGRVSDYELVVIDNASDDDSVSTLKQLTREAAFPNVQVYALTKEVDADTATIVGLENALGDFVVVVDPRTDDLAFLPTMLSHTVSGVDVVMASNEHKTQQGLAYRACSAVFNRLYAFFNGVHLSNDAPQYSVLSKSVVNFILQHPMPAVTYRHLPATGGFARVHLKYNAPQKQGLQKSLGDSIDRGMRLLVSTTRGPVRLVTALCLFGAVSNLLYSLYVIGVALLKKDIEPGWVTLSLQQSGMFFLMSCVLLVLGEYILHTASLSNRGPLYHVAQEFTSEVVTRHEKLNVEDPALIPETRSLSRASARAV